MSKNITQINYRGLLQECCQASGWELPKITVTSRVIDNSIHWEARAEIERGVAISNPYRSKKSAIQNACKELLNFCGLSSSKSKEVEGFSLPTAHTVVHVDADYIKFISPSIVESFPSVYFIFDCREYNAIHIESYEHLKNCEIVMTYNAHTLIVRDVSQLAILLPNTFQIIASTRSTNDEIAISLPFVDYVSTDMDLLKLLKSPRPSYREKIDTFLRHRYNCQLPCPK